MKVVTGTQMAEIDRRSLDAGVTSDELMENAGRAVAEEALDMMGGADGMTVLIICGKGNNGGDGLVAARYLKEEDVSVVVLLATSASELRDEPRTNLSRAREAGVAIVEQATADRIPTACEAADLVIDALLGTGVQGPVKEPFAGIIEGINTGGAPILAVDVPSGVNADTGEVASVAVRAQRTVTLGLYKWGLLNSPGLEYAGETVVADIGLPAAAVDTVSSRLETLEPNEVSNLLPKRKRDTHKGDCGRILVIAGSVGYTGAAALSSMSALRTGAGLVTLAVPGSLNDILEAKVTEVITRPLPETTARSLSGAALDPLLELAGKSDVVILGPGVSLEPETSALIRDLVTRITVPMVIDADGLTALAADISVLERATAQCILTPHPGEMARLLGCSTTEVQADRTTACRKLAERTGGCIVLKGAATLVCDRTGRLCINRTGNPGMATAGTGDVLTGSITALIGQGLNPYDAAIVGVYLHGLAGDLAAEERGHMGLIASDVLDAVPSACVRASESSSRIAF